MAHDEHLRKAFSYFDKDGNDYIKPEELQDALMEDGADDCTNVANDIFRGGFLVFGSTPLKIGGDWQQHFALLQQSTIA
ncbi:unnamed protein product [Linum tenue]|uniref:EF-hand domain-containing protein n=1 Tax=Linum tenue TaxID=586396 RepID=A0AAV0PYM9_9ROSI|nr:unnamed protein product [Linum tenue]